MPFGASITTSAAAVPQTGKQGFAFRQAGGATEQFSRSSAERGYSLTFLDVEELLFGILDGSCFPWQRWWGL